MKEDGMEGVLERTAVVLKEVKSSGNLGAAARAMKNMGLHRMILVNPAAALDEEAFALAHSARDVLDDAQICPSLSEALSPFSLCFGTTCRLGRKRGVTVTPRQMAGTVIPAHLPGTVALVFGPEDRGLTNEDLQLCHYLVEIPSSHGYRSVNLSHAVILVCYELFCASTSQKRRGAPSDRPSREAGEHLHDSLYRAMSKVGFPTRGNSRKAFTDLCRILGRAEMTAREVSLMEGFLQKINGEL